MTEVLRLVSHPLAARLGLALLHFLWQGLVVGLAAGTVLLALRKASAAARYAALLGALAMMALCPVVTFLVTPRLPVALPPPSTLRAPARAETTPPPPAQGFMPTPAALAPEPTAGPLGPAAAPTSAPHLPWGPRLHDWLLARLAWVSLLWLAGVMALSLRFLLRGWALRCITSRLRPADPPWQERLASLSRRLALSRPVKLMVSSAARVPMVIGWLRPAVVLPASALTGLTPEQVSALLAHELAHLRRRDDWVALAQALIELLLFYHPAVWWVSRALRAEREHCCDDVAVEVSGDLAGYMGALAWVDEHRGSLPQPALAASGSPLLARLRRLAGHPSAAEGRHLWLAALLSLTMAASLIVAGAFPTAAADSEGHRPGLRDQWQPQTMAADPRLDQPVHIEILGRAAVPALKLLSEKTGVSLGVAPEDLETVGERKFTVIAQGCSLKAIMVQLPQALQECHWDIDLTGNEPAYLLHRNGSVETTMLQLMDDEPLRLQEEGRPAREARVEAARKALAMSPEELTELERTDLFLARSVKDPKSRSVLELFLSLPDDQMKQFVETGTAAMAYPLAPEHFRTSVDKMLQAAREERSGKSGFAADLSHKILDTVQGDIAHATIQYEDLGNGGAGIRIFAFDKKGGRDSWGVFPALWSQYPSNIQEWYRPLLLGSGTTDERAADALAEEWERRGAVENERRRQEKRRLEWREPRSPELHKEVVLPFKEPVEPVEVQRFVAKETGLSLVSDYFTTWGPLPIPDEARASMPIWRLLYLLGERWFWSYDWNEAGDCLAFHDRQWYSRALQECPESLVATYREKLEKQGAFTLDDVAAFAVALERHRPKDPILRQMGVMIPRDLLQAGLLSVRSSPEALLIYASLTPEQRAKARSAEGLPYAEMTRAQQKLVRRSGGERYGGSPYHVVLTPAIPEEEMVKAVFRITQSRMTVGKPGPGDLAAAGTYDQIGLRVQFPNRETGNSVYLRSPKPAAAGGR